jgi:thiamine-monophosphate kinase
MKLKEIGEFGLIDRIAPQFLHNLPESMIGIGDDCAVIHGEKDESLLITTDMLIEESHFLRKAIAPQDLGYKSLAVNLSDIAAMGGTPAEAFLSIGIPPEIEVEWLDLFFEGLNTMAGDTGTRLLGGDTTKSQKHLVINIVVIGKMQSENIKYRSGAHSGDDIFLTGPIGDSGAGLKLILEDRCEDQTEKLLIESHNCPRPHLEEGQWLSKRSSVTAMIDVSDGIDSDLRRIMEKSDCGVNVDIRSLPVSDQMVAVCRKYKWNSVEIAATSGEDYCLLCTVDQKYSKRIANEFESFFNRKLNYIGKITNKSNNFIYSENNQPVSLNGHGFDHFA